ncbi:MAG TPA: hypothetical protein VFF65_06925 [Phycisphaerales bacterium]|nr:hypothetical protein [Phycisphaerales bacterium]
MKHVSTCLFVLAAAGTAFGQSNFIDFESVPNNLPGVGGPDIRVPGDSNWYNPPNSATAGSVANGVGLGGSRGLIVGNNGSGNDGVIDNLRTPRLTGIAGESVAPVNAANNTFQWSFWFRTVPTSAPAGNYRFRVESYGPDRTTFLGFQNDGAGNLTASAFGIDAGANFVSTTIASSLQWGQWYRVTGSLTLNDGAANDTMTYGIYDTASLLVGSGVTASWEEGVRQLGYNGGQILGVDQLQFHSRGGFAGDHAYVDDVRYSVVPTPAAGAVLGLGGLAALRRRRR